MQNGWMLKVNEFVTNVNTNTGEHKITTKSIGQKKSPILYLLYLFCPISFRFLCTWNGPYLPYSQRWVWLGHCSLSHTPGISPRFYLGPPWSHSHGNCKGWWRAGREVQKLISCCWQKVPINPTKSPQPLAHTHINLYVQAHRQQSRDGRGEIHRVSVQWWYFIHT